MEDGSGNSANAPTAPAAPRRPLSRRLLFGSMAILLALALAEGTLHLLCAFSPSVGRLLGAIPPVPAALLDPVRGWVGNPEAPGHDARGFRNPKALEQADVVAIGDSQTWGAGVSPEDAWPLVLGNRLGRPVYSMSLGGYGPADYLSLMKEALTLQPRAVVVCLFTGNDIYDSFADVRVGGLHTNLLPPNAFGPDRLTEINATLGDPRIAWENTVNTTTSADVFKEKTSALYGVRLLLSRHCRLYGLARALFRGVVKDPLGGDRAHMTFDAETRRLSHLDPSIAASARDTVRGGGTMLRVGVRWASLRADDPRNAEGERLSIALLQEMDRRARAAGARLFVTFLSTKETAWNGLDGIESDAPPEWDLLRRDEEAMLARMTAALHAADIPVLDLLPEIRAALVRGEDIHFEDLDDHIAPAGHRLVADLLSRWSPLREVLALDK
jgi:hypothetical protein